MTFDEIQQMWGEDCRIDLTDLTRSSAETPSLHHKYSRERAQESMRLKHQEAEYLKLKYLRTMYYLGELPQETLKTNEWQPYARRVIKVDLPMYLEADDLLIALSLKISLTREKLEYLDNVLRSLTNRNFQIKNINDTRKMEAGGY